MTVGATKTVGGPVINPRRTATLGLLASLALIIGACQPAESPGSSASADPSIDASASASQAAEAETTYEDGDQITLIVPFSAGGGVDLHARTLQPFFQEALREVTGKDVSIVVQNVEGAGGQIATEGVFRETGDNTQLVIFNSGGTAIQQVVDGAAFDITEMAPIGQVAALSIVMVTREGVLPEDATFDDLVARAQEEPILWAGVGASPPRQLMPAILAENGIDFPIEEVNFDGTPDIVASMLREEVEVFNISIDTALDQIAANPTLQILFNFSDERDPLAPDVPTLVEQDVPGAEDIALATSGQPRVIMAPPGLEEADVAALQEAFNTAMSDEDFIAAAEEAGSPILFGDAASVEVALAEMIDWFTENQDLLAEG